MNFDADYADLVDVLQRSVDRYPTSNLFGTKVDGELAVDHLRASSAAGSTTSAAALASLGVGKGDAVAIISANRVEWAVAAYATYGLGARFVPMYEHQLEKDWELHHSTTPAPRCCSPPPTRSTRRSATGPARSASLEQVFCMDLPAEDEASFAGAREARRGRSPAPVVDDRPRVDLRLHLHLGHHRQAQGRAARPRQHRLQRQRRARDLPDRQLRQLGLLPALGPLLRPDLELHCLLSRGAAMAIAESVDKLIDNFGEVRPTILVRVPRIFNSIYDGLQKKMAEEGGVKKALFDAAMTNAERRKELAGKARPRGWSRSSTPSSTAGLLQGPRPLRRPAEVRLLRRRGAVPRGGGVHRQARHHGLRGLRPDRDQPHRHRQLPRRGRSARSASRSRGRGGDRHQRGRRGGLAATARSSSTAPTS